VPSTHPLVERFRAGNVPPPLKSAAARGALPLPAEDLLEILFLLRREPDKDLQQDIVKTIEGIPLDVVQQVAADATTPAPMLDFLVRANIRRDLVLEKVVMNPSTADATLALLAQHGSESILEFLSFNQIRLTRAPAILQAMLQSPRLTQSIRRRLQEIWELHQQEQSRGAKVTTEAPAAAPAPVVQAAAAQPAAEEPAEEASPEEPALTEAETEAAEEAAAVAAEDAAFSAEAADLSLDELANLELNARILEQMAQDEEVSEEELRLAQKLLTMTIPEKVQLALKGDRNARMVLIRDSAKMVQEAVIQSPKITDNELEQVSRMRSISVDVIRALIGKREAMKSYTIVINLVKNPKTPVPDAMTLMQRLQDRDLQFITKDKNVPDPVRRQAGIVLQKRAPKKPKKVGH
jgi:hypothetical protein